MSSGCREAERAEAGMVLSALYGRLRAAGYAAPEVAGGHLIRPLLSLAGAASLGLERDAVFWSALAAVQLAHEASLVHDDVVDGAALRRSAPTLAASRGVAAALVEGDHLLATAYRLAAATDSPGFVSAFAHAVERTVAGEKFQGRARGLLLDEGTWRRIVEGKSGELLGCALAAGAYVACSPRAPELYVLGRRIGVLYQMLDDLLDYIPNAGTGKPPLSDYTQQRWTWPLLELDLLNFDEPAAAVAERFAAQDASGGSPLRHCVARFERVAASVRAEVAFHMPQDELLPDVLAGWQARARDAARAAESAAERRRVHADLPGTACRSITQPH